MPEAIPNVSNVGGLKPLRKKVRHRFRSCRSAVVVCGHQSEVFISLPTETVVAALVVILFA